MLVNKLFAGMIAITISSIGWFMLPLMTLILQLQSAILGIIVVSVMDTH